MLINNGIKVRKVVQKQGEFIIPRALGYHAGFNSGYNIAEAVNFALLPWLQKIVNEVRFCNCTRDSVTINMIDFCENLICKYKKSRSAAKQKLVKIVTKVLKADK